MADSRLDAREIRAMLQARLPELLAKLFPQYAVSYPVFAPLNPTRADRHAGSFVIWTRGPAAGGFNEYSPAGPPASGDVIDLIAYVHGRDRAFAFAYARDFLGLAAMDAAALGRARVQARAAASQASAAQSEAARKKIVAAAKLWGKRLPIAGSLAEDYLAARRVPLVLVRHREDDLGFIPRLEHWKSAVWDGERKVKDGPHFPVMIAALRNRAGDVTAVHCTFLRADGSGKADVAEPKLMRGLAKGSAIRLTRGADDLPLAEAAAAGVIGPLVVSEGIENGLSVALALPEARVLAAGSFDLMIALDVSEPIFDPVIYAADNDDNARGEDALADQVDALRAAGKRAGVMRAHGVKDFNALM